MGQLSTLYVSLGKCGDLISMLPILHDDFQKGQRPSVMVCKEYAGLFSGVSYADPIEFDGSMWDLDRAMQQARGLSGDVKSCQVLGNTEVVKRNTYQPAGQQHAKTDSFQKEVYQLLGRLDVWRRQPKPVFDQRNPEREQALIESLPVNPTGAILVALGGNSSPFQADELLLDLLHQHFTRPILDLSHVKAEQIYDLLGVLELGWCLVATDSALLHLAHACDIPVVALINDKPSLWHGAAWRVNHICHIRYSDFAARALDVIRAMERLLGPGCYFNPQAAKPRIFHVWSGYELTKENRGRHRDASKSWENTYWESERWVSSPHELGATGFDSRNDPLLKQRDRERWPFLKQVIRTAALRAADDDVICLTRCDTAMADTFKTERLSELPCYAHRTLRTEEDGDTWHPIVDLFAFTKAWWREHQQECPELILGNDPWWNRVFLSLIKKYGGKELPWAVYRAPSTVKPVGEATARELHNERLHKEWQEANGPIVLFPQVAEQVPTVMVNRHALHHAAYNPSIIRWNNRLLLAYRFHNQNDYSTALAIADIDEAGNVKSNKLIAVPPKGGSEEDCRLFTVGNALYMSYVDSNYPSMPSRCVTRYGRLTEDTQWVLQDIHQPVYGDNHGNAMVKNLVFFEWDGRLLCFYSLTPDTVLLEIKGDSAVELARYDGPHWPWGPPRGGTAPLPFKGKLLRFFHSGLDNECPPQRRRYYAGAMLTEATPPFKLVAISKEPMIRGSELDDLTPMERSGIIQYKPKVIFPMGAIQHKDGWLVSCGINDAASALVYVTEKDLKL